ncbi:hypothetical protein EJB05_36171, partial [Eragrostis curvula]
MRGSATGITMWEEGKGSALTSLSAAGLEALTAGSGDLHVGCPAMSNRTARTALLVAVPVAVTLLVLLSIAVYICKKNRKPHKHVQIASNRHDEMGSSESIHLSHGCPDTRSDLNVPQGTLQNGQNIAVKRLSAASHQGQAEMKNEVVLVAKLQHKNLVRLLGYCIEQHERLLVYELLSNKSLDKILYGSTGLQEINWAQKYKIIEGIGRGLTYLHEDSRLKIIHRDLKPGNILLDAYMNPKISDFGLAKLFNIDSSVKNTRHNGGTYGYIAPEYAMQGIISAKSDVFSYGVIVLEIITRKRPYEDVIKFVWRHWREGNVPQLVDWCPVDEHGKQEILSCIHIGLLCVQDDAQLRPRMHGGRRPHAQEPPHDTSFAYRATLRSPRREAEGGVLFELSELFFSGYSIVSFGPGEKGGNSS